MMGAVLAWAGAAAVAAALTWLWAGALGAAWAVSAVFGVCAARALQQSHQLARWLRRSPWPQEPPRLRGVWRESAQRMQRAWRQGQAQAAQHAQRLQHFLQAIEASPNGVVLLDAQGRIEWCNDTASVHLGLDATRDRLQHVVHLLRDPLFARYFAQPDHRRELLIEGRSASLNQRLQLSVHLHAFGEGRQLLLTRDVTELEHADAMRRDFVANVSHEIRTPLTVLGGFIETLQTVALDDAGRRHCLDLMATQSARMQALVADLLTLSQLEGSPLPSTQERVELQGFMALVQAEACSLSSVVAGQLTAQQGHELVFAPVPQWTLQVARAELYSAVFNLVGNAIRYTPAGGRIHVAWAVEAGQLVMAVTDAGPGIAPDHLPRLSERFYRVDRSRSRETGGTGLGLAIAKHVVQRHGGQLRIHSELGKGSCFALVLPLSRLV